MVECNICKKEFKEDKNLHLHIKAHKLAIGSYYHTQFPKYDRHTKELIKFKNKQQYFSADFNTKKNLKCWLKNASLEKAREYCKGLLVKKFRIYPHGSRASNTFGSSYLLLPNNFQRLLQAVRRDRP